MYRDSETRRAGTGAAGVGLETLRGSGGPTGLRGCPEKEEARTVSLGGCCQLPGKSEKKGVAAGSG